MRVFLAGATGAIGRTLLPALIQDRHDVIALSRSAQKASRLEAQGARVTIADAFDRDAVTAAIRKAEPEVVIHQLTALTGVGNFKKFDREFAVTNRLRTEVTDTLIAAARHAGARRFIAQSYCGWPFAREGGAVKTEEDPLDPHPPASFVSILAAIRYLEEAVRRATDLQAVALRYGMLYGPGTAIADGGTIVRLVHKRMMPIVGSGAGVWSFTHVSDAASATVAAVRRGAPGIYNVVDDDPAPVATWLPALAQALGAKPPRRCPVWLGRVMFGDGGASMMTTIRGGSNAKAKREFAWEPAYASWRRGFVEGLA